MTFHPTTLSTILENLEDVTRVLQFLGALLGLLASSMAIKQRIRGRLDDRRSAAREFENDTDRGRGKPSRSDDAIG